jgi:glycosyltransferase involved in cell wall biosynthesis
MRILHFLWSGAIGGAERSVYQLVREQLKEEWDEIAVLFANANGPYVELCRSAGCRVEEIGIVGGTDLRALPKIVSRIRAYDLHHLHSVEPLFFLASIAAGRKARVFTQRGGSQSFTSFRKRLRYWSAGPLLRHFFHGYSGNTAHAAAVAALRYGLPSERVVPTYNGIELELLATTQERRATRESLGVGEDVLVIGTSAHLKEWKQVDRLLAAASRLDGDYRVLVVGDGPDRPRLEGVAVSLGIAHRVIFTGMLERVADCVQAMDVFVLPSNATESFGNAVVEAMALGVPSIVFADSPGVCEHIESGLTGFIASSVEDLTRTLRKLADAPGLRAEVGARGADFVRTTYTPPRMADAYRRLYEEAVVRARR